MKVKVAHKTVYIGAMDKAYDTEDEAVKSLVILELANHLFEASLTYDYETFEAAEYLIEHKSEIIDLLNKV